MKCIYFAKKRLALSLKRRIKTSKVDFYEASIKSTLNTFLNSRVYFYETTCPQGKKKDEPPRREAFFLAAQGMKMVGCSHLQ